MGNDFLQNDDVDTIAKLQKNQAVMAHLWVSYAEATDDLEKSKVVGKITMRASPTVKKKTLPAATLWWDGFVIPSSLSDTDATIAFQIALEGTDQEVMKNNRELAVWLVQGYRSDQLTQGAVSNILQGIPRYPASEEMLLLHNIIGNNIPAFLSKQKNAKEVLKAIEQIYTQKALEAGLLELGNP